MPRLTPLHPDKIASVLRANGLVEVSGRGKGDHRWFQHPEDASRCTSVPDYDEISVDLLTRIVRQAGKTRDRFLARLHNP